MAKSLATAWQSFSALGLPAKYWRNYPPTFVVTICTFTGHIAIVMIENVLNTSQALMINSIAHMHACLQPTVQIYQWHDSQQILIAASNLCSHYA